MIVGIHMWVMYKINLHMKQSVRIQMYAISTQMWTSCYALEFTQSKTYSRFLDYIRTAIEKYSNCLKRYGKIDKALLQLSSASSDNTQQIGLLETVKLNRL